jgi:hypothetical protein
VRRVGISRAIGPLQNQVNVVMLLATIANLLLAGALSIFGDQMYPFFILLYIWIAVYVLFVATLIRRESTAEDPLIRRETHLVAVIALAVLFRLIFVGETHHISLDALWYVDFGKFMHMGAVPYSGFYFPYPPVFAYVIYALTTLYEGVVAFRLFAIIMDAAVLVVLWKLVNREIGPKWASTAALAYALLPISVIETGWNGHFEPLANLLLLLALWFLLRKKYRASGALLGLAAATKIYPLVVFPILFAYIKEGRDRLWFTISAAVSGALTFVPIILVSFLGGTGGTGSSSSGNAPGGLFESLFGFLYTLPFPAGIITIALAGAIVLGVIHLVRRINRNEAEKNASLYRSVTIALGVILIAMGIVAAVYPLLPASRLVYWRFPIDVGLVRGITTICVGLLIILNAKRASLSQIRKQVTPNTVLVIIGATALLLIAMARLFFYGWYLLWSIPFFLLLRDQRLSYTVLLCLLLVYPNYTNDNFAGLGFEETRQWQDGFSTVDGWASHINIEGDYVNASQLSASVDTDGTNGRFWFDTRQVVDDAYLNNVSFSYTRAVYFTFDGTTAFVARIMSSWDPPFGRYADLSLSFLGVDGNGEQINGSIIPRTSIFTNLTYILWRYAFTNLELPTQNGTVTNLNLTVYPAQRVESFFKIDFMYTTHVGLLNPVYFLVIPSLLAIALSSFVILSLVFERQPKEEEAREQPRDRLMA